MANLFPHFTKGALGKLNADFLNQLIDAIKQLQGDVDGLRSKAQQLSSVPLVVFPAEITGYRPREGDECNRFEYSWKRVVWDELPCKFVVQKYIKTINGDPVEAECLTSTIAGDDFAIPALNGSDNLSGGKPVEGNPIVPMFHWKGTDGKTVLWFYGPALERVRVQITSSTLIEPNRYKYTGQSVEVWNMWEARWYPSATPTDYTIIYNLAEEKNTALNVRGIVMDATRVMLPIQNGERQEIVGTGAEENGEPVYQFNFPTEVVCANQAGLGL